MAVIELKGKYYTPHNTMVLASFPFTFRLIQGSGQAEYKQESEPYPWKVDLWHACRVRFTASAGIVPQGLGAFLEVRDDGELEIELGYTYLFGLSGEAPAPVPEPPGEEPPAPPPAEPPQQPEPEPTPPPVPPLPVTMPRTIVTAGYPQVTRPEGIMWGPGPWMDLVWSVPEAWVIEAWAEVRRTLIDRINEAIARGEYIIEYRVRG